jgi:hypothetical protein
VVPDLAPAQIREAREVLQSTTIRLLQEARAQQQAAGALPYLTLTFPLCCCQR